MEMDTLAYRHRPRPRSPEGLWTATGVGRSVGHLWSPLALLLQLLCACHSFAGGRAGTTRLHRVEDWLPGGQVSSMSVLEETLGSHGRDTF